MHLVCIQVNQLHNVLTLEIAPIKKKIVLSHTTFTLDTQDTLFGLVLVSDITALRRFQYSGKLALVQCYYLPLPSSNAFCFHSSLT